MDVIYLDDRIEVRVDGQLEIELDGEFPAGRFGVYTGWQSESPVFADFQVLPPFPPFRLEVDPQTGWAQIRSVAEAATELRSYSLSSDESLLATTTWEDTNLTARGLDSQGDGLGQSWSVINAAADQIFEAFLTGGSVLEPGETLVLGRVIEPLEDGEAFPELSFDFVSGAPGGQGDSTSDISARLDFTEIELSLAGDFDQDQILGAPDIDFLSAEIRAMNFREDLDLDGDGVLTNQDRFVWIDLADSLPGDADLNGQVEFADFLSLSGAFGSASGWADGDFDGDGEVQFADFLRLSQNFGNRAVVASVPEPSTRTLLLAVVLLIWPRLYSRLSSRRI